MDDYQERLHELICNAFKVPKEMIVTRVFGPSQLVACAKWFDIEEEISKSRRCQMRNSARPAEEERQETWRDRPPLL